VAVAAYCVAFGYFVFDTVPCHAAYDVGDGKLFLCWVSVIPVNADDVVFGYDHVAVGAVASLYFECA
jgi:hypothetical protein